MTEEQHKQMRAKVDILRSMAGSDPDIALSVLTFTLLQVAYEHDIMFASLVKNIAELHIVQMMEENNE